MRSTASRRMGYSTRFCPPFETRTSCAPQGEVVAHASSRPPKSHHRRRRHPGRQRRGPAPALGRQRRAVRAPRRWRRSTCAAARRARARPTCSIPSCRVERIDAICLSGGSAFGLSSADGVMRWLQGARPRRGGRRRRRADRAHRHPVRPAERRRQGLGLAALSRARLSGDRQGRRATSPSAMPALASAPRRAISRAGWAAPRPSIRRAACRSARWWR